VDVPGKWLVRRNWRRLRRALSHTWFWLGRTFAAAFFAQPSLEEFLWAVDESTPRWLRRYLGPRPLDDGAQPRAVIGHLSRSPDSGMGYRPLAVYAAAHKYAKQGYITGCTAHRNCGAVWIVLRRPSETALSATESAEPGSEVAP
jgi:hypothetical protein